MLTALAVYLKLSQVKYKYSQTEDLLRCSPSLLLLSVFYKESGAKLKETSAPNEPNTPTHTGSAVRLLLLRFFFFFF